MDDPILHSHGPQGEFNLSVTLVQPITIGRHERNQLCLDEQDVSRFHCIVLRIGQNVHVVDLQSRNGTLINGARVSFAPLRAGDVMEVGKTRITLTQALEEHPPRPMPMPPLGPKPRRTERRDEADQASATVDDFTPSPVPGGSGIYSPSPDFDRTLDSGSSHNSM